jgi:hypothetical protein
MQFRLFAALAGVALLSAAMPAAAAVHVIDFEDRADGNQGTNVLVYPAATFTGSGNLFVNGAGVGKDLCALGSLGCVGTTTVSFASAVSNLSFTTLGDNLASQLFVAITFADSTTLNISRGVDGNTWAKDAHDLSAYSNIVGLVLSSNDPYGLAYDDFRFETAGGNPGGVPEPASWAMLITGFGLAGAALRRRPAGVSVSA